MSQGATYTSSDGRSFTSPPQQSVRSRVDEEKGGPIHAPTFTGSDGASFSPYLNERDAHFSWSAAQPRLAFWRLPSGNRLVVAHSPHRACGISAYGHQLDAAMALPSAEPSKLGDVGGSDVLLVHYEPALVSLETAEAIRRARSNGAFVVFCCHYFDATTMTKYPANVHVVHRDYPGISAPSMRVIPLGCPLYGPGTTKDELRKVFGLPRDVPIVTGVSLLTHGKDLPRTVAALLERLPSDVHLQLIYPPSFHGRDVKEEEALAETIRIRAPNRVTWIREFIPDQTLLDRIFCSTVGFRYTPTDTGSVSAAVKQFISARCPVVVSASSHTSDTQQGILRVPSFDVWQLADAVSGLLRNTVELDRLSASTVREYDRINMSVVAKQYLDLFARRS